MSHGEGDSNRVPLPGSSFRVAIAPAATDVPSCMRLFIEERDECGHGLNEPLSPSIAGQDASFFFVARDSHSNARGVGGDLFSAILHGPEVTQAEVEDQGDGAYVVRYCPRRTGVYQLAVTRGEMHIAGSPFSLTVHPGAAHVPSCAAYGPALQLGEAGERQSFIVEARHMCHCTHHTHCTHCTHCTHDSHDTYDTYCTYCTHCTRYTTPTALTAPTSMLTVLHPSAPRRATRTPTRLGEAATATSPPSWARMRPHLHSGAAPDCRCQPRSPRSSRARSSTAATALTRCATWWTDGPHGLYLPCLTLATRTVAVLTMATPTVAAFTGELPDRPRRTLRDDR